MHTLIVGMTESGKTTLAKLFAKQLHNGGKVVAVLDPIADPDWVATLRTRDVSKLSEYMKTNRRVFVFVDESGEIFNNGNDLTYSWFATRSRHYGHSVMFVAQRATQIPKTMRDQCSRLYLFTSSVTDGKIHSEEWNKPELEKCNVLPQMYFYCCDRYSKIALNRIENYSQVVSVERSDPESDPENGAESVKKPRKRVKST